MTAQLLEMIGYTLKITGLEENSKWSAINTSDLHASFQIVRDGPEQGAPSAWHSPHNFNHTTHEVSMLAAIENESKNPEEAAAEQTAANENIWSAQMP